MPKEGQQYRSRGVFTGKCIFKINHFTKMALFVFFMDPCEGGHRHRSRCRRLRHSSIMSLSPVPEHSSTGLVPASAFLLIQVPD